MLREQPEGQKWRPAQHRADRLGERGFRRAGATELGSHPHPGDRFGEANYRGVFVRARYRYSPVSALYLLGRRQDMALQKARGTIHQRNHMRLWLSPYSYQGRNVWIGQISRDIGFRFTTASPFLTTHKIDPDVDDSRDYLIEDLAEVGAIQALAYVKGAAVSTVEHPAHNLTGDPHYTDGLRVVIFLPSEPVPIEQVDFIKWENLPLDKTLAGRRVGELCTIIRIGQFLACSTA
jgi:hypothetical protein